MMINRLFFLMFCSLFLPLTTWSFHNGMSLKPDSAYLFAYASLNDGGRAGLHFAWSTGKQIWHAIGPDHSFLRCDYGRWGAQKRMLRPFVYRDANGMWHCVWSVNEEDNVLAHAQSEDLVKWQRQSYPEMIQDGNCLDPIVYKDASGNTTIGWRTEKEGKIQYYKAATSDFKTYSKAAAIDALPSHREEVYIGNKREIGSINKVAWGEIDALLNAQALAAYKYTLWSEQTKDDHQRFASLDSLKADIRVQTDDSRKISDLLMGVFFEDINYAADGGLYAELVQNRGFEYRSSDKEGKDETWNHQTAWKVQGNGSLHIDSVSPIHPNNKFYAVLDLPSVGAGLQNKGFDGISIKQGATYLCSFFARALNGIKTGVEIRLVGDDGTVYGSTIIKGITGNWKQYQDKIVANTSAVSATLEVKPLKAGTYAFDLISLFPENTFKNRKNGLRADLSQTIAEMRPRFVRFPGGCVAHGDGLENMYRWKNTIGPLEERVPQRNLWGYHQSAGLGYFEYFQFCEDIGAEPLPVVPAAVPCQNSGTGGAGQQGGISMEDMDEYIQEIFDLIDYANGDKNSTWGKKRAAAGHPEPFNLKYIGIGNEDLITDVFEERFRLIFAAMKKRYPAITVIGTVGPSADGTDYREGWELADALEIPMVDEHYYQSPGWFIHNQDYYDRYDRSKSKVYLGEYAAHLPGRPNNLETALAEALYLTSLERNGDVVHMASYAPLLAKEGHTQWNPDLIYFNNEEVKPTVGYYVQQLYGQHSGDTYFSSDIVLSESKPAVSKRFGVSAVRDEKSGDLILKIVNLLPTTVQTNIDFGDNIVLDEKAIKITLKGDPTDLKCQPVEIGEQVSNRFKVAITPYSFTVYRIKTKMGVGS